MSKKVREIQRSSSEDTPEEDLRDEVYKQFGVGRRGRVMIHHILPHLEKIAGVESRYNIDKRSKILAEIALFRAYEQEPKFKMFAWAAVLLACYDYLHHLEPIVHCIIFLSLATVNGFISSLRSPSMMAAELEGAIDEDGMPANYRAKAITAANTNVTLILFMIAVGVQLAVPTSVVGNEVLAKNISQGEVSPIVSGLGLLAVPFVVEWYRENVGLI